MSKRLGLKAVYVVVLWTGILLVGFHILPIAEWHLRSPGSSSLDHGLEVLNVMP
jgi:hypothetical protein